MAFGIEYFNNYGNVLIDGTRPNYAYYGTVAMTRINGADFGTGSSIPMWTHKSAVISSTSRPVIGFDPQSQSAPTDWSSWANNSGMAVEAIVNESGGWIVYMTCGPNIGPFNIDVWVDITALGASSGYGMQVFAPSGALAFDTGQKPIKILGDQQITLDPVSFSGGGSWGAATWPTVTFTSTANRVYFFGGCSGILMPYYNGGVGSGFMYSPMITRTGTTFTVRWLCKGANYFTLSNTITQANVLGAGIGNAVMPGQFKTNILLISA